MAEYQPSLAICRPKIQAVTECTRMAQGRANREMTDTAWSLPRCMLTRYSTLITRYSVMTQMSHTRGEVGLGPVNRRQMRWMPPRSMRTNMPAKQMHTVDRMIAGMATALKRLMWKTLAEEATIRPPAESPTKNMNMVMYRPHDTPLDMPVTARPPASWKM